MKNLMSMVDFTIQNQRNDQTSAHSFFVCVQYANFLKLLLELWMFVPCKLVDGVWVVLEEPDDAKDYIFRGDSMRHEDLQEYQQAKERCLFEGFEIIKHPYFTDDKSIALNEIINVFWHNNITGWNLSEGIYTIEDLVKHKPLLTATAKKQIGL